MPLRIASADVDPICTMPKADKTSYGLQSQTDAGYRELCFHFWGQLLPRLPTVIVSTLTVRILQIPGM